MIEVGMNYVKNTINHHHRDTERNKEIAFLEAQVYEYVEILGVSQYF